MLIETYSSSTLSDLYIVCQLWADNKPLTITYRTAFKAFKDRYMSVSSYLAKKSISLTIPIISWNEIITLPIRYRDLPLSSQLVFTIYDYGGLPAATAAVPVGGTTLRLFGKKCTLKKGKQRMLLWPDVEGDASVESSTPSKIPGEPKDQRGRLEKVCACGCTEPLVRPMTETLRRLWRDRSGKMFPLSTGSTNWPFDKLSGSMLYVAYSLHFMPCLTVLTS